MLSWLQLNCVVVPTKALADPAELDKALAASLTSGIVAAAGANFQVHNFCNVFLDEIFHKWTNTSLAKVASQSFHKNIKASNILWQ